MLLEFMMKMLQHINFKNVLYPINKCMNSTIQNVKIACVEYNNTLPFLYGLKYILNTEVRFDLHLAPPSKCIDLYRENRVDIALVPIGGLTTLKDNYHIMQHICIGCNGAVDTVAILSQTPIHTITSLYLDPHSNTSNLLAKVLCQNYWNIEPQYHLGDTDYTQSSILAIGDKVLDLESNYAYKYDLGAVWKEYSGLPFVFAVWIVRKSIPQCIASKIEQSFVDALRYPEKWIPSDVQIEKDRLHHYLTENIVYRFDNSMREGLNLYNSLTQKIHSEWISN